MSVAVGFQVKRLFLDREAVIKRTDRAKRRAMSRVGGFMRTTARRSMRKRKKPSPPGRPPSSHQGDLRRHLYFAYEPERETVVVGPVGFSRSDTPAVLERGGSVRVRNRLVPVGRGVTRGAGGRFQSNRRMVRFSGSLRIKARPYMGPANEKTSGRLPGEFAKAMGR